MKMKMKILMVTHVFPPKFGGAAIQSIQLSRVLKTLGFEPDYFTDNDRAPSCWDMFQEFRVFRARTFLTNASRTKQLVYTWRLFWFLAGHPEYRIVHFHSFLGFETVVFPLLRAMGRRLIVKLTLVGSDDPVTLKRRKLGFLLFRGLQSADRLIAISDGLFALSLESGFPREKVSLISNGVDIRRFSPVTDEQKEGLKAALGFSAYPTIFLSMGKVEERKGYAFLLEAWARIQQELPSAALLIAGPDNTRTNKFYLELERSIVEDRLRNVFFLGEVQKAEDYFRIADCFLFCSRREGFGTVLVEAMCCSVPVVATNIDGITQNLVIQPDIGRICYSRSAGEFSGLAVSFIRAKDPAKLQRAAEAVRRHFDIRRIAERYQALYRQLSGQPAVLPAESWHPSVSVIIPTLNRPDDLRAALESIAKQTRFPDEILIVDQSSDDRTRHVIARIQAMRPDMASRFHYVRQEEKSSAKARNRGLDRASGDVLSFLDDDVVLHECYFEKILEFFGKNPEIAALSGNARVTWPWSGWKWALRQAIHRVFLINHYNGRMTASGFGYPIYEREIDRVKEVEMLPGCNMNFRRDRIQKERFDEWFTGYSYREDAEFSYRISRRARTVMIPDARLVHNYSQTGRLSEEELKRMKIRNYTYVFHKFKGRHAGAALLFAYSLVGLSLEDLLEFIVQRSEVKWRKFTAGVHSAFSVWKNP